MFFNLLCYSTFLNNFFYYRDLNLKSLIFNSASALPISMLNYKFISLFSYLNFFVVLTLSCLFKYIRRNFFSYIYFFFDYIFILFPFYFVLRFFKSTFFGFLNLCGSFSKLFESNNYKYNLEFIVITSLSKQAYLQPTKAMSYFYYKRLLGCSFKRKFYNSFVFKSKSMLLNFFVYVVI